MASALVETIAKKIGQEPQIEAKRQPGGPVSACATCRRSTIIPRRSPKAKANSGPAAGSALPGGSWRPNFVTIDTGTGIVHQAPAFGEVDFDVLLGRAGPLCGRPRPAAYQRRRPRRHIHRRGPRLPGPLGQRCDQATSSAI